MTHETLAGMLRLRPGATPAVVCARPMVGAALLDRLTQGRRAALLPDLLASVFTLCSQSHRSTARRAVRAALGRIEDVDDTEALAHALHVVRDHLQRLALDLPAAVGGAAAEPHWLIDAPVLALPQFVVPGAQSPGADTAALHGIAKALPGWLERRLFGMPCAAWLEGWQREQGDWLARWCAPDGEGRGAGGAQAVARWLHGVRDEARALAWPHRPLAALRDGDAGARDLAAAIAADARFAERPTWRGQCVETGPWTRLGFEESPATAWDRLGARLADIARLAGGARLSQGALALAEGTGLAWAEMARGLLVHWVRLEPGASDAQTARVARCRVLAPTEWNFHPDGEFARWLARGHATPAQARLAAAALDPCVAIDIEEPAHHA